MDSITCIKCGQPPAFPQLVKAPWTCISCKPSEQPPTPATGEAKAAVSSELVLLLESAMLLNEIVEGVRNERWESNGRRLKDTAEWCNFYCKLQRAAQQQNEKSRATGDQKI